MPPAQLPGRACLFLWGAGPLLPLSQDGFPEGSMGQGSMGRERAFLILEMRLVLLTGLHAQYMVMRADGGFLWPPFPPRVTEAQSQTTVTVLLLESGPPPPIPQ